MMPYMTPYTHVGSLMPLADDIDFWSRQASEHGLFMALGLDDKTLKRRSESLHQSWENFRRGPRRVPDAVALVLAGRELKLEVHGRLLQGEWLGWLWPLFIDHIRREEDYFLGALQGTQLDAKTECQIWLTFMSEHIAFAIHLLDPSEAERMRQAMALQGNFNELWKGCGNAVNDQLLSLTQQKGMELDAYLQNLGIGTPSGAKSVIHPVIAEHVVREGRRFLATMNALQSQVPR